jgi:hypothetical protein
VLASVPPYIGGEQWPAIVGNKGQLTSSPADQLLAGKPLRGVHPLRVHKCERYCEWYGAGIPNG